MKKQNRLLQIGKKFIAVYGAKLLTLWANEIQKLDGIIRGTGRSLDSVYLK